MLECKMQPDIYNSATGAQFKDGAALAGFMFRNNANENKSYI